MKHWISNLAVGTSLLLGIAVCVFAVRAKNGSDRASWTFFRYLPDDSVASNELHLTSNHDRVWLEIGSGQVGPFNGQLVWGYHVNADQSGGYPKWNLHHEPYDDLSRWMIASTEGNRSAIPMTWETTSRTKETNGDDSAFLRVGISHWLLALLFFVPPMLTLNGLRQSHFGGKLYFGLFRTC